MSTATAAVLPSKKRKASHDSAASAQRPHRKESEASSKHSEDTTAMAFRTILDCASLTSSKTSMPPKKRKQSFEISEGPLRKRKMSSAELSYRPRFASAGSIDDAALGLVPLGSLTASLGSDDYKVDSKPPPLPTTDALDHLDALGDESASMASGSKAYSHKSAAPLPLPLPLPKDDDDENSSSKDTMASGNQRLLVEALMMGDKKRRDRFESWGGMSDVSFNMGSTHPIDNPLFDGSVSAAALAASARHMTQHGDEASITSSVSGDADKPVPSRISLTRERLLSVASLGDASVGGGSNGSDFNQDLQAVVAAAMLTVGDQLAELAGVMETVAGGASVGSDILKDIINDQSSVISTASSLPEIQAQLQAQLEGRPRAWSTSSNAISVDYDAVAAAVDAATAATGSLNMATIADMEPDFASNDEFSSSLLPPIPSVPPLPKSDKSERDMEAIRARARAAAGYIPPANLKAGEVPPQHSIKKRPKATTPNRTPCKGKHQHYAPESTYSLYHAANKASSQKWDEMYDSLLEFVDDRRQEECKDMSEKEKSDWEWDGNVPTTYKTSDGKALGRWINNQRSAKHKGNLKKDREMKLIGTGLKWSVLSTNSWQDMMDELKLYVMERTKEGQEWDGNVPTNYKIKGSTDEDGEEKNLGRWINRQRSLYQSGKLRKDREADLERIGLKWSVLSTTSWQSMYDTLLEYVDERKAVDGSWDGNVPANHKTNDHPPKALGRWINRQRTAHQKNKLKDEFVDKLNEIGLKWSVHERRPPTTPMSQLQTPLRSNLTSVLPTPSTIHSCSTASTSVSTAPRKLPNGLAAMSTPMVKVKSEPNATPAAKVKDSVKLVADALAAKAPGVVAVNVNALTPAALPKHLPKSPLKTNGSVVPIVTVNSTKPAAAATVVAKVALSEKVAESKKSSTLAKPAAVEAAKPANETLKPANEAAKPASEAAKPASEAAKPPSEVAKPASDVAKQAREAAEPAREAAKPGVQGLASKAATASPMSPQSSANISCKTSAKLVEKEPRSALAVQQEAD